MTLKTREEIFSQIEKNVFDVVVVGGGITGSGVARDAAQRGLKTLLIEKGDFASGTSSKSGKLIHGGLRYLTHAQFKIVFESCNERQILMNKVAPHLVKPILFLKPFYASSRVPKWLATVGLFLYEFFIFFRIVKHFQSLSPQKMCELEPTLKKEGSKGALLFYDCVALDYRLTIDTLKSAHEHGAVVVNYCEAKQLKSEPISNFNELIVRDHFSNQEYRVKTKTVVNAAGAWMKDVFGDNTASPSLQITKGIHLIFDAKCLTIHHAIAFESKIDARDLYLVPLYEKVLLGTTDTYYNQDKDKIGIENQEVDYLLNSVNALFPEAHLERKDIETVYAGIRPLMGSDKNKKESSLSRDYAVDVTKEGVVSVIGGKLTIYRRMACSVMDKVAKQFFSDRKLKPNQTREPISGGHLVSISADEMKSLAKSFGVEMLVVEHLVRYYGSNFTRILSFVKADKKKGTSIGRNSPHIWAEIDYAVMYEFVETLDDFMRRRSVFFMFTKNSGLDLVESIGDYMAKLLQWSQDRLTKELNEYKEGVLFSRRALV